MYNIEMRKLSTFTFLGWFSGRSTFSVPMIFLIFIFCESVCCVLSIFISRFPNYVFHFSFASQFEWKIDICLLCCCRRSCSCSWPCSFSLHPPAPTTAPPFDFIFCFCFCFSGCCWKSFSQVILLANRPIVCRKSSVIRLLRC